MILGPGPGTWPVEWRERFEERAAILEFDAGFSRWEAELRAKQACREQAAFSGKAPTARSEA